MSSTFGFPETTSVDEIGGVVVPSNPEQVELKENEKQLRDLFVSEYLVDYDQVRAAQRCGFAYQFAIEYATKLMAESYVQRKISSLRISPDVNETELEDYNKRRIREGLIREAFYSGPGASHAARVSALKALAQVNGMIVAPGGAGSKGSSGSPGGVMAVPGIADLDAWEQTASNSQDNLAQHADRGE